MPGKYSHSAVLADYSSRGIISLPNDQHVAYLRTAPYAASQHSRAGSRTWSEKSPGPQQRSQSAMAFNSRYAPGMGTSPALGRRIIIENDSDARTEPKGTHRSDRPSTSATTRRFANHDEHSNSTLLQGTSQSRSKIPPSPKLATNPPTVAKALPNTSFLSTKNETHVPRPRASLHDLPKPELSQQNNVAAVRETVTSSARPNVAVPTLGPAAVIRSKSNTLPAVHEATPIVSSKRSDHTDQVNELHRKGPRGNWTLHPKPETTGPDFSGFSDAEEQSTSYFQKATVSPLVNARSDKDKTTSQSRDLITTPPREPSFRPVELKRKTSRSDSTEPSESGNRADRGASPLNSNNRLDSLTSQSTISSVDNTATALAKKRGSSKREPSQPTIQDWKLPEIDEDGAFGPDFFTQGAEDLASQISNDSIDSFLARPLGTISAGRDIDFTKEEEEDNDSEVDAACPPDIGRFRNEEEFGSASFLQSKRSDSRLGKVAGSPGQTHKRKMGGFFSKFRSKNK